MTRRTKPIPFDNAVSNWARASRRDQAEAREATGWASTCGSAERLYASSAERDRSEPDSLASRVPVDRTAAKRFEALLRRLRPELLEAWHIAQGTRPRPDGLADDELRRRVTQARAFLALEWYRSDKPIPLAALPVVATTIALLPVLRELLKSAGEQGLTLGEMRRHLLDMDVEVQLGEISSCMVKALGRGEVSRKEEKRTDATLGRRRVYRYTWVASRSAPAMTSRVVRR